MVSPILKYPKNDIDYLDLGNTDHEMLGKGAKKALYNYMHGIGFDYPMSFWFDEPNISPTFIEQAINN